MVARGLHWRKGWDDIVPLGVWAIPMVLEAFLAGVGTFSEAVLVVTVVGVSLGLKHLLSAPYDDLTIVPPAIALLVELSTVPVSAGSLLLVVVAGVGLLLWFGSEPTSGLPLGRRLEPAVVPALAVGVAFAVMLFLPAGTGGQVGLAALALVAVMGLVAWLYLRSAAEVALPEPTS